MSVRRAIVAALLLAFAGTACGAARASGVFTASDVEGAVEVRAGGDWEPLSDGRTVAASEEVRTGPGGSVTLEADGTRYELGGDTWMIVGADAGATAKTGSLLAESERPIVVGDGGGVTATGPGAFRLDYGRRVASYRGTIAIEGTSGNIDLPPLRELTLGLAVSDVRLMVLDEGDRWDRRYLADAIEIDRSLAPYERSFDVNAGVARPTLEFIGTYVDPNAIGFLAPLLGTRLSRTGPFDALVSLLIAIEHANVAGKPLPESFSDVLDLREQGATFGVVALALSVEPGPLLRRVLLALNPAEPPQKVTPIEGSPSPRPRATGGGSPTPSPSPTGSRRPTSSPTPTSSPSPTPTQSGSPSPSPSPSPTCEIVDQLMGTCTPPPIIP